MSAKIDKTPTADPIVWVLTDGKIGDDVQCLGVAEALTPSFEKRVVAPRPPWEWMAPWGPVDPKDAPTKPNSSIAPPYPDVVIASGRRAIPYARKIKRASGGNSFIAIMKDPRIAPRHADLVWAPSHDRLEGENVVSTLTSPHGLTARLIEARKSPSSLIAKLRKPMLGVMLGGPSGGARYDTAAAKALLNTIRQAKKSFHSLAVTPSRRTPDDFFMFVKDELGEPDPNIHIWDGNGDNPYIDILANADALIVAADSHNMMSEATAAGKGVYAWRPPGLAKNLHGLWMSLKD